MSETLAETTDPVDVTDVADTTDVPDTTDTTDPGETTDVAAAAPEPAPAFDLDSPEVQARLEEMTQAQFNEFLQTLQGEAPQVELGPPPDPFDSDDFPREMAAWQEAQNQRLVEQLRAELAPLREIQAERINTQVNSIIDETAGQFKLDPSDREDLEALANGFAGRVQGEGEAAVRAATRMAAERLQQRDKRVSEAAVKRYQDSFQGGGGQEPGVNGGALDLSKPASSYEDATRRVLERHGIPYS